MNGGSSSSTSSDELSEPTAEDVAVLLDGLRKFHSQVAFGSSKISEKKRSALNGLSDQMDAGRHLAASTLKVFSKCVGDVCVPTRCRFGSDQRCSLKFMEEYHPDNDIVERSRQMISVKKPRRSSKNVHSVDDDDDKSIPAIPEWLESRVRELGGSGIRFVMEKKITQSDLSANNNRLSIPAKQIRQEFLTDEEKQILRTRDDAERGHDHKKGKPKSMDVQVVDPEMKEHTLCLKRWEMGTSVTFNLTGKWKEVVKSYNLQEDQIFNIWCYRNTCSILTFLLVSLTDRNLGNPTPNQQQQLHLQNDPMP